MAEKYITLTFDLEPDEEGHAAYLERWPDFKGETVRESIIREIIATLEIEGLTQGKIKVNGRKVE